MRHRVDAGFQGQIGLERGDGVAGLEFLPETHDGIRQQQHEDDDEVRPMLHQRGKNRRRLDHPRNRPPEMRTEFEERIAFLLRQFVVAVLRQPSLSFRLGKATCGTPRWVLRFRIRCLRFGGCCDCDCVRLLWRW